MENYVTVEDWTGVYGPGASCNRHTHGMEQFNHLDFQVVLNVSMQTAANVLVTLARRVAQGEKFEPGQLVDDILLNAPLRLDLHIESKRQVLRAIFPDDNNRFPEDPECEARHACQIKTMFEVELEDDALGFQPIQ